MSKVDVLIAIANGDAIQGPGIVSTISISGSGAAIGATINSEDAGVAAASALLGTGLGIRAGTASSGYIKKIADPAVSEAFGAGAT